MHGQQRKEKIEKVKRNGKGNSYWKNICKKILGSGKLLGNPRRKKEN